MKSAQMMTPPPPCCEIFPKNLTSITEQDLGWVGDKKEINEGAEKGLHRYQKKAGMHFSCILAWEYLAFLLTKFPN